jgi:hypothetical protein
VVEVVSLATVELARPGPPPATAGTDRRYALHPRDKHIGVRIARKDIESSERLSRRRWVIEGTISWRHRSVPV